MRREIVVAMSGASGAPYGVRALEVLSKMDLRIHFIATPTAQAILKHETGRSFDELKRMVFKTHAHDDFFSPVASGSHEFLGMVVIPCSMKTVGLVANGIADDLVARTAEVCLKERRPLVMVPRETPLTSIGLRNLATLSDAGAFIVPAMPAFYTKPETLDEAVNYVVGKALDCLRLPHDLYPRWRPTE